MKLSDRVNAAVHPLMVRRMMWTYQKKMERVKKWHPELFSPIDSEIVTKHCELWGALGLGSTDYWVTWLSNISGTVDYRYCPEDLLYGCVERVLNDCARSGFGCEDKNQFFLYVPHEMQAKTYLRFVRGAFYDEEFRWVSEKAAQSILDSTQMELIGKVCVNSLGGHGITKFEPHDERLNVDWIKKQAASYVIQEKIKQCDFSARFNPHSANSCKIVTLRCPWSGEIKVVKAGMRFGQTKSVFDNLSSGGLSVCVNVETGALSPIAYNWFHCDPHPTHPLSGAKFGGAVHPHWEAMKAAAIKYAAKVPDMNMLSWDMLADVDGNVKILEVNASSQSSDWLQFAYGSLFGDETENVVDWCAKNKQYDLFSHFRTFY